MHILSWIAPSHRYPCLASGLQCTLDTYPESKHLFCRMSQSCLPSLHWCLQWRSSRLVPCHHWAHLGRSADWWWSRPSDHCILGMGSHHRTEAWLCTGISLSRHCHPRKVAHYCLHWSTVWWWDRCCQQRSSADWWTTTSAPLGYPSTGYERASCTPTCLQLSQIWTRHFLHQLKSNIVNNWPIKFLIKICLGGNIKPKFDEIVGLKKIVTS